MRSLLEVDVRNAVVTNVVVINNTERSTRGDALYELGGGVDIRIPLDEAQGLVGARRRFVGVLGGLLQTESVEVYRPASEPSLVRGLGLSRMALDGQRCTEKAEQQQRSDHDEDEAAEMAW